MQAKPAKTTAQKSRGPVFQNRKEGLECFRFQDSEQKQSPFIVYDPEIHHRLWHDLNVL